MDKLPSEVHAVESRVQIDGKCVTSRGPGTAMEYSVILVEQLYGKEKATEVAGPMVGLAFKFQHIYIFSCIYLLAKHCRNFMLFKNSQFDTMICCFLIKTSNTELGRHLHHIV